MFERIFLLFIVMTLCLSSELFHENSKTVFLPQSFGAYFGYSVLLKQGRKAELIVGAPKSDSLYTNTGKTGMLYRCPLDLQRSSSNVTCAPYTFTFKRENSYRYLADANYLVDDMWLGATIAGTSDDFMLVCAPRWTTPYSAEYLLMNGLCFDLSKDETTLRPFSVPGHAAFLTDGRRKEYGASGTVLNYYAYAQGGMSVTLSRDQSSLLVGAPGLLQWTGGVVQYQITEGLGQRQSLRQRPIANPYFTLDLHPNDYFGYSVETGVFEPKGPTLCVAGAPRAGGGLGQVFIFTPSVATNASLAMKAKLQGPQLGAYFGSSVLVLDLNADGLDDLLVGAPNYVSDHDDLPYDQGAVFVYITAARASGVSFTAVGSVRGSGSNGAYFGLALAALGDVDGDGYPEVAIGAPWESDGRGAVYVYSAFGGGLRAPHVQRLAAARARGFGIAISRGLDVDNNGCNDLAVGAHMSDEAALYRCVPTVTARAAVRVPGALDLSQDTTNFTALFCISVDPADKWPHVNLDLHATISVDKKEGRAYLFGNGDYNVLAAPGSESCEEKTIGISEHSDLSRPISLTFEVNPEKGESLLFSPNVTRLSVDSVTHSTFRIQLTRDCGEDLICQPELNIALEYLSSPPYVPGAGNKLGVIATILNSGEPAYGATVNFTLPTLPMRVPSSCSMFENNMTCHAPSPLNRNENITYLIELDYVQEGVKPEELNFTAEFNQHLYKANNTEAVQRIVIQILPTANLTIKGKVLPNVTLPISRDTFSAGGLIKFVHYFEITNFGPSNWPYLEAEFTISDGVSLSSGIHGCLASGQNLNCSFDIPASVSTPIALPFIFDLKRDGNKLEDNNIYEATTLLVLKQHNLTTNVTTTLVLEAAQPLWPIAVGCVAGLVLLATIIFGLYKCGFFKRSRPEDSQENENILKNENSGTASKESLEAQDQIAELRERSD